MSNVKTMKKRGNLKDVKDQLAGPVKVYLDSGRRNPKTDELIMEPFADIDVDGRPKQSFRPEREKEPFLEQVFYRRNYMSPKMEEEMKLVRSQESFEGMPLHITAMTLSKMLAKWDLVDGEDEIPVPATYQAMIENDIPADVLYSVLAAIYEHNRPPKESSGE